MEEPHPPKLPLDGDGQVIAQCTKRRQAANELDRNIRPPSDLVDCIPRQNRLLRRL